MLELVDSLDLKSSEVKPRVGSIPTPSTTLEKSMPRPARGGARRPNRTDFSGQKEIPDSVRSSKEKF